MFSVYLPWTFLEEIPADYNGLFICCEEIPIILLNEDTCVYNILFGDFFEDFASVVASDFNNRIISTCIYEFSVKVNFCGI